MKTLRSPAVAAVLISAAIGFSLSYAVLFIMGLVFVWVLVLQGTPGNETYAVAWQSTTYLLFAHVVGGLCLLPGGLWAAKLSAKSDLRNAALAGLCVAAMALIGNFVPYDMPTPLWSSIASSVVPVPAFVLGALLARRAK